MGAWQGFCIEDQLSCGEDFVPEQDSPLLHPRRRRRRRPYVAHNGTLEGVCPPTSLNPLGTPLKAILSQKIFLGQYTVMDRYKWAFRIQKVQDASIPHPFFRGRGMDANRTRNGCKSDAERTRPIPIRFPSIPRPFRVLFSWLSQEGQGRSQGQAGHHDSWL